MLRSLVTKVSPLYHSPDVLKATIMKSVSMIWSAPNKRENKLLQKHKKSNLPFILHCASGSTEYIKKAVEMGGYVGIAGNVTYKNADAIREIVKATPADRLLLETDAPFLPPHPHRGKTCEPWMIELTAQYLQEHCSVSMEQVYKNTQHVFTTLIHA